MDVTSKHMPIATEINNYRIGGQGGQNTPVLLKHRGKLTSLERMTSLERKTFNLIEITPTRHLPEHEEYNVIIFLHPCLL